MRAWSWFAAALLALGLGCGGLSLERPLELRNDLEGSAALAAAALAGMEMEGRFPDAILAGCDEHAPRFVWLAARHDEPAVVRAALGGVGACAAAADPVDARAVVAHHLASEDRATAGAAFAASAALVADAPPGDPLLEALVRAATGGAPAVRYEALLALDERAWAEEPAVVAAYAQALAAEEPWLVTEALRIVRFRAAGLPDPGVLRTPALLLARDKDPGIRGRSALLLARLAPDDEEVRATVLALLDDPHPFARASASEALADMAYLPAVHGIVTRLDDPAKTTWDMLPFARLDGTELVQHHTASIFERVDDAHLRALVRLTEPLGDDRFVYRDVNLRYLNLDVVAATRDARRWYDEVRGRIPER